MGTTLRLFFLLCFIALASFCSLSARAQMAGNYTINPAQPASSTNFHSFNDAINALRGGLNGAVVIDVAPNSGPYHEQLLLDQSIHTTATNTLTFNCNGVTLSFLAKEGDQKSGVMLNNIDYVTFDSLVIVPQGQEMDEWAFGFHLLNDADHNTIRRCRIINNHNLYDPARNDNIIINGADSYANGLKVSNCDSNLITCNYISGGYCGVTISSNPDEEEDPVYVKDNVITNNIITDVDNAGVLLNGYSQETLVSGNDISAPNALWTAGIRLQYYNESCIISNNRIHNIHNPYGGMVIGIEIAASAEPGKENIIANNCIYDIVTDDVQMGIVMQYGSPGSYIKILHNTIVLDDQSPGGYGSTYGINLGYYTEQVTVMNNIVSITRNTTDKNYAIYIEDMVPGLVCDYNNLYISAPSAALNAIGYMQEVDYENLAAWQAATGHDAHSASYDPLFTQAIDGNLYPGQGAMDNMGTYVNIDTDITGAARHTSTPDIGAYEFVSPPCTAPVAGNIVASPSTSICEGSTITLTLQGHSFGTGQTYVWQMDSDMNGDFSTAVSGELSSPAFDVTPVTTRYYRAAVTCGATTVYTVPIQIYVDPALEAGTYTIDPAQPTGGSNFNSFSDAINAMHCGVRGHVVFNVAAGTYSQQLIIPNIPRTSASRTVTFRGNNSHFIFTSINSDDRAVIQLNGCRYITVEGFDINVPGDAEGQYGFGIQLINNADHNTVKNNTITLNKTSASIDFAGIVMSPRADHPANIYQVNECDSNTIVGNTIHGGFYGITCTSYDFGRFVTGNQILNNTLNDNYGFGIYVSGTSGLLIEGNEITRPTRTQSAPTFMAIRADQRNHGLTISRNRIHNLLDAVADANNTLMGIGLNNCTAPAELPNTVVNNLVYNFTGTGAQYGLYYFNSDHTRFFHNTISLEDSSLFASTYADVAYGFALFGASSTGMEFANNNITMNRTGRGVQFCIYIVPTSTTYNSNYNNLYVKPGDKRYVAYNSSGGVSYSSLAEWQGASGQDAASVSMNPEYKNPAAGDYTPTTIDFENRGVYRVIDTDINGQPRSQVHPDIGAFEFFTCTGFPEVQVVNNSFTVCNGADVQFEVKEPEAGNTYYWYNAAAGGDFVHTGTSLAIPSLTGQVEYWVEARTAEGCASLQRVHVRAESLSPLTQAPVVKIDTVTVNSIRFKWTPVPGAMAYQVSRDGIHFTQPSSGAGGLTHTMTGLNASDSVSIVVRALALLECQQTVSERTGARTLTNQFFIPNTFTPNGNGRNDVFKVYSNVLHGLHLMIFNQWGEKVFETTNPQAGWDGTFRGRPQPVGVYVYVARLLFEDGVTVHQKGTLHLVR
jgi:parallel beta-helix repeat (two copies)